MAAAAWLLLLGCHGTDDVAVESGSAVPVPTAQSVLNLTGAPQHGRDAAGGPGASPEVLVARSVGAASSAARQERAPVPVLRFPREECEQPSAPSACTWLQAVDAVVVGRVQGVELAEDLLVTKTTSSRGALRWQWVERCDEQVQPALKIAVKVIRSFSASEGGPGVREEDRLEVRIGADERTRLDPSPFIDRDGALQWRDQSSPPVGRPLERGQIVGMAVHRVEDAPGAPVWSLLDEAIFGLDENELVRFGIRDACAQPPPEGLEGLPLSELETQLSTCPARRSPAARRNRAARRRLLRPVSGRPAPPSLYSAGVCRPPGGLLPRCTADADCSEDGARCVLGSCVRGSMH